MVFQKSVFLFLVFFTATLCLPSDAYTFNVGGKDGWTLNPSENYNQWSSRLRFLVNDTLRFKYNKGADSVLVVNKDDYDNCNTNNPIMKLDNGDSLFNFDRSGPFYFISGNKSNCDQGQKLLVRVLSVPNNRPPTSNPPSSPATPSPTATPPSPSSSLSPAPAVSVSPPTPTSPAMSPTGPGLTNPSSPIPSPTATPPNPSPTATPPSPSGHSPAPAVSPMAMSPPDMSPASAPSPPLSSQSPSPGASPGGENATAPGTGSTPTHVNSTAQTPSSARPASIVPSTVSLVVLSFCLGGFISYL